MDKTSNIAEDSAYSDALLDCIDPAKLALTILPTEKCNFRCTYCYEAFEKGKMSRETIDAVKKLIFSRRDTLSDLTISWFGGEPLIASDVVKEISRFAHEVSQEHGFSLASAMTTNGYLLSRPLLQELLELKILKYQISIDGTTDAHNLNRPTVSGKPTFDRIVSNLESAKTLDKDFEILIRVHYTPEIADDLIEIVNFLKERFGDDHRFGVHFASIERLREDQVHIPEYSYSARQEALTRLESMVPPRFSSSSRFDRETYICYASKPNSMVIRSNGEIAKCTVALSDPRNSVGHLTNQGQIEWDQSVLANWHEGIFSQNRKMLACPYDVIKRRKGGDQTCNTCTCSKTNVEQVSGGNG